MTHQINISFTKENKLKIILNDKLVDYLLKKPDLDLNKKLDGGDGAIHEVLIRYFLDGYKDNISDKEKEKITCEKVKKLCKKFPIY